MLPMSPRYNGSKGANHPHSILTISPIYSHISPHSRNCYDIRPFPGYFSSFAHVVPHIIVFIVSPDTSASTYNHNSLNGSCCCQG